MTQDDSVFVIRSPGVLSDLPIFEGHGIVSALHYKEYSHQIKFSPS